MLSTCLIIRDELNNLKILLPQLKIFSDEIIVVDTGSIDGSYEYLKTLNYVKLFKFKWNNDFAEARNFSIVKATKKFILWVDADDRIKNPEELKKIKFNLNENEIYAIKLINSSDSTFSYQLRIFPNFKNIKFKGKVHEQLVFNKNEIKPRFLNSIEIIHTGYESREQLIKKHLRNIKIINSIKDKSFYDYIQLGESLKIIGDFKEAFKIFNFIISSKEILKYNPELYCFIFTELYKISEILGLNNSEKFLILGERYGNFFPPIFYYIARNLLKKKNYTDAEKYLEKFLEKHSNHKYLNPVPSKLDSSAIFFLAKAKINLGKIEEAENLVKKLLQQFPFNKNYKRLLDEIKNKKEHS